MPFSGDQTTTLSPAALPGRTYTFVAKSGGTTYEETMTGALTPTGATVRQSQKSLTGATAPSGVLTKQLQTAYAGMIAPTGVLPRQTQKTLAGGVTPAGTLATIRTLLLALTGNLTFNTSVGSLRFYGQSEITNDRVVIPIDVPDGQNPPVDVSGDFTIEFWVRGNTTDNAADVASVASEGWIRGNTIFDRDIFDSVDEKYGISFGSGRVCFGTDDAITTAIAATNILDDEWHHVACMRDASAGTLTIYVDGVSDGSQTGAYTGDISYPDGLEPEQGNYNEYIVLGNEKHDAGAAYPSFAGYMTELRISDTVRYTSGFTPQTTQFAPDANTMGLYHFGDASGTQLTDSATVSGAPTHGTLIVGGSPTGPTWESDSPLTGGAGSISLILQVNKILAGATTPSGALLKQLQAAYAGAITPTGVIARETQTTLTGAITPSGALVVLRSVLLALTGAITPTGSLLKQITSTYSGALAPAGSLLKQIQKALAGALGLAGSLGTSVGVPPTIAGSQGFADRGLFASFTFQVTIGSGATALVVICSHTRTQTPQTTPSVSGVTLDGNALTELTQSDEWILSTDMIGRIGAWVIYEPDPGTDLDVVISFTGGTTQQPQTVAGAAVWFEGTPTSAAIDQIATSLITTDQTTVSGNLTTATNQSLIILFGTSQDFDIDPYILNSPALDFSTEIDGDTGGTNATRDRSYFAAYAVDESAGSFTLSADGQSASEYMSLILSVLPEGGGPILLSLAGAIAPIGALLRQTQKTTAGALTPTGALLRQMQTTLAGDVTPTGALLRQLQAVYAGLVAPAGALLKDTQATYAGVTAPTGAVTRQTQKTPEGDITLSGALATIRTFLLALAGAIAPSGALLKQLQTTYAGVVTPAGTLLKQLQTTLSGAITPTGALGTIRTFLLSAAGAIAPSGALVREAQKAIVGAIAPVGSLGRQAAKTLAGSLASAGALIRDTQKTLSGAITPAGDLDTLRTILLTLTGVITPTGALLKQAQQTITGALTPLGTLVRQAQKTLSGSSAPSGALSAIRTILLSITGVIAPAGALIRQTQKTITGAITPAGATIKSIAKSIIGAITPAGALTAISSAITGITVTGVTSVLISTAKKFLHIGTAKKFLHIGTSKKDVDIDL